MTQRTQTVYWGSIDWVIEPEDGSNASMRIGIMNIEPGKSQVEHVHFSDEQFLYIVSGKGEHYINGEGNIVTAGDYFHCPPGVYHATHNLGDDDLRIMVVSVPMNLKGYLVKPLSSSGFDAGSIPEKIIEMYLIDVVIALQEQLFSTLSVPISVFTSKFMPLLSGQLPETCQKNCKAGNIHSICRIVFEQAKFHGLGKESCSTIVCPYGLTVLLQTIMLDNQIIGFIQTGHVKFSEIPDTTVIALYEILADISTGIQRYCVEKILQHDLNKKEDAIKKTNRKSLALHFALEQMQERMLHVQIKNHFLFNTLNSIASIALRDGSNDTYSAIVDLSDLLYGLMHKEGEMLTLAQEMKTLEKYINLQKLRCGEDLIVEFKRDSQAENIVVPFQCLQPIVENCFVHGFKDVTEIKHLSVSNSLEGNKVKLVISDNGSGISKDERARIKKQMQTNSRHGLAMVNHLLKRLYGKQYKFVIKSNDGEGTTIQIDIPYSPNSFLTLSNCSTT